MHKINHMAVKLLKSISRELVYPDRGKTLIVSLEPGDIITYRQKGKRTKYSVSLHKVQLLALMESLLQKHQDKLSQYNQKKQ